MKHATRDIGLFIGSSLGACIIGIFLFMFIAEPCAPINQEVTIPPDPLDRCAIGVPLEQRAVGSLNLKDFVSVVGAFGAALGFVLALISEYLMPD